MKTRNLILTAALLMAGSWAGDLMAQQHLNALMKKCETMNKVEIQVISEKDRKTKKPTKEIITVTFSVKENPTLKAEFIKAFQLDKEAAYKSIESKINGQVVPSYYRFAVGTSDITYSMDGGEKAEITRIERFDFKEESEWG